MARPRTPAEMLTASRNGTLNSSSSMSPVIPFSSSSGMFMTPVEPSASPSMASSSSAGPNTTTNVKSSSTAPAAPTETKQASTQTQIKNKSKPKGGNAKPQNDTPNVASAPQYPTYTPPSAPVQEQQTQPRENFNMNWQDPALQKPATDEHRTVLQALMGWDDVPFGQRWHHYIQHGFTGMHGQPFQELMQLVQAEGAPQQNSATYGQELRAKEQHRKSIIGQWDKLLSEWNSGRYASGDQYTVQEFFNEANRLRNEYANAGYNPNELRRPAINAGGFQQGFQKSLQEDRNKLDWIGGWLNDIQQNVAKNPNWLNSTQAQMYFDKLSEYTILNMAQSRGAIADAEKIRAQVEAMPRADRQVYDKFMNMFFNANTIAQLESMANAGNRDAMATLEDFDNFVNLSNEGEGAYGTLDKFGNVILSDKADHYLNAALFGLKTLAGANDNPININTAVTSYKNARDAFQQYVMQNANVDRQMVWDTAVGQYNIYKDMYNRKLPQLGLQWGWEHKGPTVDQDFGGYLANWQRQQSPNSVMRNATLAVGNPPSPTKDPIGNRGGGGGSASSKTQSHPANAVWDEKLKKWKWREKSGPNRGQWRFSNV